jgi:glycosyltransferase involved in cell wall biosynthesis
MKDKLKQIKILMLGMFVPDEEFKKKYMSNQATAIQSHIFNWSIVQALESVLEKPVDILSTRSIEFRYPMSSKIFVSAIHKRRENGGALIQLPIINFSKIYSISIFIFTFIYILGWSLKTCSQQRVIYLISLNMPLFFAVFICRFFFRIKIVTLVNDSPGYSLSDINSKQKTLISLLQCFSMKHVDGIIGVTKFISLDFAPLVKSMVMECIAHTPKSDDEIKTVQNEKLCRNEFIFVNVGSLYKQYGIQLLVDAFRLVKNPNARLNFFGKGPMVSYIEEAAANDPRIQYCGFVSNDEVVRQEMNADVLVNPRPSQQEFVRYSFPIKLMEYLSTGTAVVTTKLCCIPDEYEGLYIPIEDETPEGLAALLEKLTVTPREELHELGMKSAKFVRENKNEAVQGKRMVEFIESLL